MKRSIPLLLLALLLMLSILPVSADSIWEPDDAFYDKHHDDVRVKSRF